MTQHPKPNAATKYKPHEPHPTKTCSTKTEICTPTTQISGPTANLKATPLESTKLQEQSTTPILSENTSLVIYLITKSSNQAKHGSSPTQNATTKYLQKTKPHA